MMKTYLFLSFLGLALCTGCAKDKMPAPSTDQPDPFIRYDNPKREVDHQVYLYYQQTGVPVLYTDTISAAPLVMLNLGYHITAIDTLVKYTLLASDENILRGLRFIREELTPYLGDQLMPYSIFLVDSLYNYASSYSTVKVLLPAYKSLNTIAIGNFMHIDDLDPVAFREYRAAIFKTILSPYFSRNMAVLTDFFAVSAGYYGKRATGTTTSGNNIPYKLKEEYGLLSTGTESTTSYDIGTQPEDLDRYLTVVLNLSEEAFTTRYGSYPLVMKKYAALRDAFTAIQFSKPE